MKTLLFSFLVCWFTPAVKGQSSYHFRFGGDWIATSREKARYTFSDFIGDFGFPLEGVTGDGIIDRWDSAVPDHPDLLMFPYNSLSDPPSYHRNKFFSANTVVLDSTLPEIPELLEVVAINDPDGDILEFRSVLPSGRSRSHFHFWMVDQTGYYGQARMFDASSSMSLSGLEVTGMGRLRWIVCDGSGQWWVSESDIDPGDPVLRFETADTDGRWARLSGPRANLGAAELVFEETKFTGVHGFGFGNFDNTFIAANESVVRFRRFDVEAVLFPKRTLPLQPDLRVLVRGSRWGHDDVHDGLAIGGPRIHRVVYRKSARFQFSLQNDSEVSLRLRLRSTGISRKDRLVVVDEAGSNQTARIRAGMTTANVESAEFLTFSGVKRKSSGSRARKRDVTYALLAGVDIDSVKLEEIPSDSILRPYGAGGDQLAFRFLNVRSKRGK